MIRLTDIKLEIAEQLQLDGDIERSIFHVVESQYSKRTGTNIENSEIETILYAVENAAFEVSENLKLVAPKSFHQHDRRLHQLVLRNRINGPNI